MPRKNRVIYEGAIYHIYQRGNNREYIFEDDRTKIFFLKYLKEYNKKFDYEVLAYVIMGNHYHLLIKTNKISISQIMFYFNNVLGKYINNKLNRTGHVFEDRYKCELVDNQVYLIFLLRYIHRNPVKAHICDAVKDYRWSSHNFYIYCTRSCVNTNLILSMMGNTRKTAIEKYLNLISLVDNENDKDKDYNMVKEIFETKEEDLLKQNFKQDKAKWMDCKTLDEIVTELNISENILMNIKRGVRKPNLTPLKLSIITKALEECYSLKEIAEYLNVVPSTISKMISRNKII